MVVKLFYFFVFFPSCGLVCFSSNNTDTLTSGWSRCDSELRWLNGFTMSDICIFYYLYTRVLINNKMESNDVCPRVPSTANQLSLSDRRSFIVIGWSPKVITETSSVLCLGLASSLNEWRFFSPNKNAGRGASTCTLSPSLRTNQRLM